MNDGLRPRQRGSVCIPKLTFTHRGSSKPVCMWSPCGGAGREHSVPVNICKCGSLLIAGQWLCTNGCQCVDGGRTSPRDRLD